MPVALARSTLCRARAAGDTPLQQRVRGGTWTSIPGNPMHTTEIVSLQALRAETPEALALSAMMGALRAGHPLAVAYSGGKDSSVLANLALSAALAVHGEGGRALVAVTHADVGAVENPEIRALVRAELQRMQRFAASKGLALRVRVAHPAQSESFAVRVIGGRALPAFPDSRRDCTSSWKREPSEKALRTLARELRSEGWQEPVLMTGVRRDESTVRAGSIARRGEQAAQLWTDREGRRRLSPLLDWTADDVWGYLGLCRQGVIEAYSDFEDVLRVYQDAGGSSCVVVADADMERHAKPCASRFGCWACTAVREDRSLRQMIVGDPTRYGYMAPLAALRDFIAHTQYDWGRRQYIGRTIRNGFITIAADTYSPSMLAELLRYALSVQKMTGIEIVSAAQLICIDARWSLYVGASEENVTFHWAPDASSQHRSTFPFNKSTRRNDAGSASCAGVRSPNITRSFIPGSSGRAFRNGRPLSCICWPKMTVRPRRSFRSSTTSASMGEPVRSPGRTKLPAPLAC
jgi:3'-phosphoadenosine 5'-phosphosulfate sulfotransferase (PAPS reductase)/FAD synthetase